MSYVLTRGIRFRIIISDLFWIFWPRSLWTLNMKRTCKFSV